MDFKFSADDRRRVMFKKKLLLVLTASVLISGSLIFGSCTESDFEDPSIGNPDNIRIGLINELVSQSVSTPYTATELAISEINAAGGINGQMMEVVLRDAYEDFGLAAMNSVEEFHNSEIDFVIGPGWSFFTYMVAEYTVPNGMILMPHAATSPGIADIEDNGLIWRTCASDNFQAVVAASYIFEEMQFTNVGVLYPDDGWGTGLAEAFRTSFTAAGGTVSSYVEYPSEIDDYTTYDYTSYCDSLMAGDAELVFCVTYWDQYKIHNDLSHTEGYQNNDPIVFQVERFDQDGILIEIPEEMWDNLMAIVSAVDERPGSSFLTYKANYQVKYPNFGIDDHVYFDACAYDEVYLLAYAMLAAGTTSDVDLIATELKDISGGVNGATVIKANDFANASTLIQSGTPIDYDGASGRIEFDDNGDSGSAVFNIFNMVDEEKNIVTTIYYP